MLMDFMRRNTRNFLIATIVLIVPAFILWGTVPTLGSKEKRTLLRVGHEKISFEEFAAYYQHLRETFRLNLGTNYSPELEKMLNLKQQALDRLIQETLLRRELERLKIVVSDEEVQESLKQNPAFYTNGKFDPSAWNAALGSPRINWPLLIEQERGRLRFQKLEDMIRSEARVTEQEIRDEYQRQFEKARVEFAAFKTSDFADTVEVTPDDLVAYYEQHKEEYKEPALVKLACVAFEKEPSQMDYSDARQVAASILDRARAGDDFAELAEKYSDDTATAANGGDLGFFSKGDMVKEFEDVAFSLEPGEMSEVIQSPFGYHIIKVEEVKGEGDRREVRARHILVKVEPSDDTLLTLEEEAARLSRAAQQSSLEQAALEMKLSVSVTPEFVETNRLIPTFGVVPEISEILPALGAGGVSHVIDTRTAFYVVQVRQRTPERLPELPEIEEQIRTAATLDKARALAKTKAEETLKEINENGLSLGDIDKALRVQKAEPFTRRGVPPELPALDGLVGSAFQLSAGEAAGPFMSDDAAYVVQLKEKIAPDPEAYETWKETIETRLLREREAQVFEDYYQNLKKRYKLKIDELLLQAA